LKHEGLEDHERLRTAFHETEAVVRCLIRRAAHLPGGWWPVHDIAAYAEPWPDRIARLDPTPKSVWHDDRLPPTAPPAPGRLPRNVAAPDRDLLVSLTEEVRAVAGDHADLLAGIAVNARMRLIPDSDAELVLGVGSGDGFTIEPNAIFVGADRLHHLDDVARFVGLTVDFTGAVGYWTAIREFSGANDNDVTMRTAIGSWYQYQRLVAEGELPPELLRLPASQGPADVAVIAGWAAAGDARAGTVVDTMVGPAGDLARTIREAIATSPPTPHRPSLDW
jgi:hypothetical protein